MFRRTALIILLTVTVINSGCSCGEKVRIGIMTKLDSGSIVGVSEVNAARLFIESKKIKNIEIVPFDDAWDPDKTVKAYEAVRRSGIDIIITSHTSTCAVRISDQVNRDKVLMFVTGAATDALSDKDDYIIRNVQDVRQEQRRIAEYIGTSGVRALLVIRDIENSAYTEPALRYFRDYYRKSKPVVLDVKISELNSELLESRIRGLSFDGLYLLIGGHKAAAGSIAQLVHNIKPSAEIVYTPWLKTPSILETAGDSLERSVFPSIYRERALNPEVDSYFAMYRAKFGEAPTFISLNVYTALQILSEAVNSGYRDPDSIKSYIINKGIFHTDFGQVILNSSGDMESPFYFIKDIRQEFK